MLQPPCRGERGLGSGGRPGADSSQAGGVGTPLGGPVPRLGMGRSIALGIRGAGSGPVSGGEAASGPPARGRCRQGPRAPALHGFLAWVSEARQAPGKRATTGGESGALSPGHRDLIAESAPRPTCWRTHPDHAERLGLRPRGVSFSALAPPSEGSSRSGLDRKPTMNGVRQTSTAWAAGNATEWGLRLCSPRPGQAMQP
jgi:hypothetical protein